MDVSSGDMSRVAKNINDDFLTLKRELDLIPQLQAQVAELQEELAEKDKAYANLEAKFQADEEVIENYYRQGLGMASASHNRKPKKVGDFKEVSGVSGTVLQVDAKYGYIVINLTKYDVYEGLNLSVHSNSGGDFLAMISVLAAEEHNSIATIVFGNLGDISVGDKVVVGSEAVQRK